MILTRRFYVGINSHFFMGLEEDKVLYGYYYTMKLKINLLGNEINFLNNLIIKMSKITCY